MVIGCSLVLLGFLCLRLSVVLNRRNHSSSEL
jgi:hypothetical protein